MTTDILTPAELDAIRGRCEAATPGPWHWSDPWKDGCIRRTGDGFMEFAPRDFFDADLPEDEHDAGFVLHTASEQIADPHCHNDDTTGFGIRSADATFIAHARADIPRLLAHVAALEALLSTAARELELSCYTDEAVTYQANKQRRLDLATRIRAALGPNATDADAGAVAGEAP